MPEVTDINFWKSINEVTNYKQIEPNSLYW